MKHNYIREIRKLIDILKNWGNCLVPNIPGQENTYAQEKLIYLVVKCKEEFNMSIDDIEEAMLKLNKG